MLIPKTEVICVCLFTGMLCFLEAGRWVGHALLRRHGDKSGTLFPAVEAAVFGLMGLLVAFAFAGAAGRFDMKRDLIVQEANAIGTAWLRIDLLPRPWHSGLREDFRCYLDSRLAFYRDITNEKASGQALARSADLQRQIWSKAVTACAETSSVSTTTLLLSSLNTMFDIRNTRYVAAHTHAPSLIRALLVFLPLICSLFAGMNLASRQRRSWIHILGFAAMMSLTVYVIFDFDSPRTGLIRLDMFDQTLLDLRNEMQDAH